ncbi:MAG: DNRLRE domain-containing protein [Bacteroidota bacterium]
MKHKLPFILLFSILFTIESGFTQDSLSIVADRDNSLYENVTGATSNGSGAELFIGRTNQNTNFLRRALIHFDLSAIPAGATIDSVSLSLFVGLSAPASNEQPASLHRMNSDWGEGSSDAGTNGGRGATAQMNDATWLHSFSPSTNWMNAGGDFEETATVNTSIGNVGSYTISGGTMVADVQAWLDDPTTNFGWMIRGNENQAKTAKKLDSREAAMEARRPTLKIFYQQNATNIEDLEAVSLKIFPNPSLDGKIKIKAEGLTVDRVNLQIVHLMGRELMDQEIIVRAGRMEENIDLSSWGAGVYVLHFRTESGVRTQKIVVR